MKSRVHVALALVFLASCGHDAPPDPSVGGGPSFTLVWRNNSANGYSRTAVGDSSAFFLDSAHVVIASDIATGAIRWRTKLTYAADPGLKRGYGMAYAGGRLIVGDLDVFGLDPKTGAVAWRFAGVMNGERPGHGHLIAVGATVYCGSNAGALYALDVVTGAVRWSARVIDDTLANINNPVVIDGIVYVGIGGGPPDFRGGAAAFDAATGARRWTQLIPASSSSPSESLGGVGVSSRFVVVGSEAGPVYGLDRNSGALLVTIPATTFFPTGAQVGPAEYQLAAAGGNVFVGSTTALVVALDGNDLSVRWTKPVFGSVFDVIADSTRLYVAALSAGGIRALQLSDGATAWAASGLDLRDPKTGDPDGFVAAPAVDAEKVYIGGVYGLYAFKKK